MSNALTHTKAAAHALDIQRKGNDHRREQEPKLMLTCTNDDDVDERERLLVI